MMTIGTTPFWGYNEAEEINGCIYTAWGWTEGGSPHRHQSYLWIPEVDGDVGGGLQTQHCGPLPHRKKASSNRTRPGAGPHRGKDEGHSRKGTKIMKRKAGSLWWTGPHTAGAGPGHGPLSPASVPSFSGLLVVTFGLLCLGMNDWYCWLLFSRTRPESRSKASTERVQHSF